MNCKGCVSIEKPFWGESYPVKSYCEGKGKEHYILDIDNSTFSKEIVSVIEPVTPLPKPKRKKQGV